MNEMYLEISSFVTTCSSTVALQVSAGWDGSLAGAGRSDGDGAAALGSGALGALKSPLGRQGPTGERGRGETRRPGLRGEWR